MPSLAELLGILVLIAVIWIILKVAKVTIKLILFAIGLVLILWIFYHVFMR